LEIRDPPLEVGPALLGQPTSRVTTVQLEEFVHLIQSEPELLGTLDEQQQVNGGGRVIAIAARSARWFSDQAAALVVAQRLAVHSGSIASSPVRMTLW